MPADEKKVDLQDLAEQLDKIMKKLEYLTEMMIMNQAPDDESRMPSVLNDYAIDGRKKTEILIWYVYHQDNRRNNE